MAHLEGVMCATCDVIAIHVVYKRPVSLLYCSMIICQWLHYAGVVQNLLASRSLVSSCTGYFYIPRPVELAAIREDETVYMDRCNPKISVQL